MSRTKKKTRDSTSEYWSRRYPGWPLDPGKYSKKLTVRLERREGKMKDYDDQ